MKKERGRRWVLPPRAKLLSLQETEWVGGDKSTVLFSQRRHRKEVKSVERLPVLCLNKKS